jgi:hypothetical protein
MAMDRVSICIPVHNGAAFLDAAIESALAQSYPHTEVLIVDDCSKDASTAIARVWADRSPRIRLVSNDQNLGLVGNWNRCIELAQGDWIKFLFQDDLLAVDCVAKLWARASAGWPFVACDRNFIFEGVANPGLVAYYDANRQSIRSSFGCTPGLTSQEYADQAVTALHRNSVGEPTVTLIRTDVFGRFGIFNPALSQLCDVEFWHRVASNVGIGFVDEPLASFRVHGAAATARNQRDRRFASDTLDRLALAHMAARTADCAPLRAALNRNPSLPSAELAFTKLVHTVFEWVRVHGQDPCGGKTVAQVYSQFLEQLPACKVSQTKHQLWRIRKALWHTMHTNKA